MSSDVVLLGTCVIRSQADRIAAIAAGIESDEDMCCSYALTMSNSPDISVLLDSEASPCDANSELTMSDLLAIWLDV